jgi:hypothetical protein
MKKRLLFIVLCLTLVLFSTIVLANNQIIINSKDWKDVYSGMQYGFLAGINPHFLVSEKHASLILSEIPGGSNISIFSSRRNPFVVGYRSMLEGRGYTAEENSFNDLSIELARMLTNISNYIIVDDSYGYNAIAVAPYAIISNSYVLFAKRTNIREVIRFLDSKEDLGKIMIYGQVERQVRESMSKYNPEIINYDGDRFANNVEIVKRYKQINDARQVTLTNGEFIESQIMSGVEPVLFIGATNVPDKIKEYIMDSNIEVGVLIGNELVGAATMVRRQTGISTFVKFARSARTPQGPVAQVEGLDIFIVPKIELNLAIKGMRYNALTRQLEVTIENTALVSEYFKGTYTITSGTQEQTVGDIDPIFIDGEDMKTILYDIEPILDETNITAKAFVIFGESKNALERAIEATFTVERIEMYDDSAITIEKVVYNKPKQRFEISLKNIGNMSVYAKTEAIDITIMDARVTLGSEEVSYIGKGKTKSSIIYAELAEEELGINEIIKIRAFFGERESALVKVIEGDFKIDIKGHDIWTYVPLLIIIILILLLIWKRKKKKEEKHNHLKHSHAKHES